MSHITFVLHTEWWSYGTLSSRTSCSLWLESQQSTSSSSSFFLIGDVYPAPRPGINRRIIQMSYRMLAGNVSEAGIELFIMLALGSCPSMIFVFVNSNKTLVYTLFQRSKKLRFSSLHTMLFLPFTFRENC